MFQFVFRFHIIFRFHAYSIWHFRYLYGMMPIHTSFKYSYPSMNLFFFKIIIIPIESFERKLWHFHTKLVGLPILPEAQFAILIFQCLDSIFDIGSLYSFKAKVLRVLLGLESPKSEHRISCYVRNYSYYSMIKRMQELACTWPYFERTCVPVRFRI